MPQPSLIRRALSRLIAAPLLALHAGFAAFAVVSLGAPAQSQPQDALKMYLEKAAAGLPGRVEVVVGRLDDRLQLAPCQRVDPYLPAGTRLWGKSQIGLRCAEGAQWNVYLPVEIRVFGRALVAQRPVGQGQVITQEDFRLEEIELSREAPGALNDPRALEGRSVSRAVAPGQTVRAEMLRAAPAVAAGDIVRLVVNGQGFSVSASGRALGPAGEGESVRVQTDSGRVVQGTARAGRLVEMRL
ncbi:MAG: flagellar basal body P-ring formation chaperone FlgA [Burkholderiales bacterium]